MSGIPLYPLYTYPGDVGTAVPQPPAHYIPYYTPMPVSMPVYMPFPLSPLMVTIAVLESDGSVTIKVNQPRPGEDEATKILNGTEVPYAK